MGAFKALVTPKVVEEAVIKVEEDVVATFEVALKVVGANGGVKAKSGMPAWVLKVIEVKDADES